MIVDPMPDGFPVYNFGRGCNNPTCFCTGRCRQTPDEAVADFDFRKLFELYGTRARVRVKAGREVVK